MTLDAHRKLTAALHGALGLFGLALCGMLGVFLGKLFDQPALQQVSGMISAMGALVVVPFALLSLAGLLGAALLWKRRKAGVAILQVCSFLQLVNIPVGTAVGAYSLWSLSQADLLTAEPGKTH